MGAWTGAWTHSRAVPPSPLHDGRCPVASSSQHPPPQGSLPSEDQVQCESAEARAATHCHHRLRARPCTFHGTTQMAPQAPGHPRWPWTTEGRDGASSHPQRGSGVQKRTSQALRQRRVGAHPGETQNLNFLSDFQRVSKKNVKVQIVLKTEHLNVSLKYLPVTRERESIKTRGP